MINKSRGKEKIKNKILMEFLLFIVFNLMF